MFKRAHNRMFASPRAALQRCLAYRGHEVAGSRLEELLTEIASSGPRSARSWWRVANRVLRHHDLGAQSLAMRFRRLRRCVARGRWSGVIAHLIALAPHLLGAARARCSAFAQHLGALDSLPEGTRDRHYEEIYADLMTAARTVASRASRNPKAWKRSTVDLFLTRYRPSRPTVALRRDLIFSRAA